MNKILIEKKYNKQLNIFLGIYITLCLIFALLFNDFFVKSKAYTSSSNNNIKLSFTCDHKQTNNNELRECLLTYTFPNIGNGRAIFVSNEVLQDLFDDYYANDITLYGDSYFLVYSPVSVGSNITASIDGNSQAISSTGDQYVIRNWLSNQTSEFTNDQINNIAMSVYSNKTVTTTSYTDAYSVSPIGNIEYVDNIEELYKYLILEDDSVVNNGDPVNPPLPEDDSLPVPQKLGTDIQNDNVGTPPFISGSWENPGSIYASFDASEVEVEIQYKPVFQLYKKVFNIKLGKVTSDNWIPVTKTKISNYTTNRFILYNAKTGYPKPFDSQTLYSGSLTDDVETVAYSDGYRTNMYNPISARIANGTNWRIRYVIGNKTSLWVVFHINSIGSIKNDESVSFENASGDPISADDVNYTNSSQTSTVDKLNVNNFFDSLNSAINGIFNTANNSMTAQDTDGSKGFYAMFKATFEKFPIFWTFFCLGLIVAILLRILGR